MPWLEGIPSHLSFCQKVGPQTNLFLVKEGDDHPLVGLHPAVHPSLCCSSMQH